MSELLPELCTWFAGIALAVLALLVVKTIMGKQSLIKLILAMTAVGTITAIWFLGLKKVMYGLLYFTALIGQ